MDIMKSILGNNFGAPPRSFNTFSAKANSPIESAKSSSTPMPMDVDVVPDNVFRLVGDIEKDRREADNRIVQETSRLRTIQNQMDRSDREVAEAKQREAALLERLSKSEVERDASVKLAMQLKSALKDSKQEVQLLNEHVTKERQRYEQARHEFVTKLDAINTEVRKWRECARAPLASSVPQPAKMDDYSAPLREAHSTISKLTEEIQDWAKKYEILSNKLPRPDTTATPAPHHDLSQENEQLKTQLKELSVVHENAELYVTELQASLKEFETYSTELERLVHLPCEACGVVRTDEQPEVAKSLRHIILYMYC
eukprot:TRINITY_DN6269_c0_g1_i1.p1 TRINITY_DN6269_c0_g1~~TRINITY_DN6269_c0_g1_i1.p1  ORF type:complete len:313 (-),score=44.00 TRINITY_DN6269_c0_g1_i1:198-1136(-)